jgi:hypothetical protein
VRAEYDGRLIAESWALNEVSVEKGQRAQMLELLVDVDGRPLSRYGCDGRVCATPTGRRRTRSRPAARWCGPEVEALLLVPISAHALFSQPLVTAPTSTFVITVDPYTSFAVLCCDGRRTWDLPPGAQVTVERGELPVRLVRLRRGRSPTRWWPSSPCRWTAGAAIDADHARARGGQLSVGTDTVCPVLEELRITGLGVIDDTTLR